MTKIDPIAHRNLNVRRKEIKYRIRTVDSLLLGDLLRSLASADPHNPETGGYFIRSLYFDSPSDRDYFDKLDGIENRRKFRLRLYDVSSPLLKLEIKQKFADYQNKQSYTISRESAAALCREDYAAFRDADCAAPIFAMQAGLYRPVILVDYEREAFTFPAFDVRITLDRSVRAAKAADPFSPEMPTIPVLPADTAILEVKYSGYLPDSFRRALLTCDCRRESVSKYCLSRQILY